MTLRKILHHLTVVGLLIVIGVCFGRIARELLDWYRYGLDGLDDISGVAEIETAGRRYTVLPFMADGAPAATRERVEEELRKHAIDYRVVEDKVMVESVKTPLAMDALQTAGLGGAARHFSYREITADPQKEPERYALQQQLADQNMLGNMLALMAAEIVSADVRFDLAARTARVRLTLKPGTKGLPAGLLKEIREHVRAVAGDVQVEIVQEKSANSGKQK